MNAIVSSENLDTDALKTLLKNVTEYGRLELSSKVTTKEAYTYGNPQAKYKIAALDFWVKTPICCAILTIEIVL